MAIVEIQVDRATWSRLPNLLFRQIGNLPHVFGNRSLNSPHFSVHG